MEDKDIEINTRLMEEFGLEQGTRRRIYDHETGDIRLMKVRRSQLRVRSLVKILWNLTLSIIQE